MNITEELQKAVQHHQAGRLAEAEQGYRRVLAVDPANGDAVNLLGVMAIQRGQFAQAEALCGKAIELSPAKSEYHYNLGVAQAGQRKTREALAAYRQAVALEPRHAAAWARLADGLLQVQMPREAEDACRKALALRADIPEAHNNLGKALFLQGDLPGAAGAFRQAAAIQPRYAEACNNLGQTLSELGQFREGAAWCAQALKIRPDFGIAHWNLSLMLLRLGEWERAWPEFEWRYRAAELKMVNPYPQPMWDGGDLGGRTILLHAEQGLGDAIQYLRYAPLVANRGGKVIVAIQEELRTLFEGYGGVEGWVVPGDSLPQIDVQCPLPSLPGRFRTTPATVPAAIPYLHARLDCARKWREKMEGMSHPRVGLAWRGSRLNPNDANRSIPAHMLASLANGTGATFFSLQKGDRAEEAASVPMPLVDWTDEQVHPTETAGLIENLDVVVTADTMMAHLAGAMGKPVWILLQFVPDWRWMLDRQDTPWYPTARLFRQQRRGEWSEPIEQAAEALRNATWQ